MLLLVEHMNNKVVVFDLYETLGYFTQVGVLFDTIELYTNAAMEFDTFCKIFDLYSEIFIVNIFSILKYLKRVKRMKHLKVMLYTNNQADKSWGTNIIKYMIYRARRSGGRPKYVGMWYPGGSGGINM